MVALHGNRTGTETDGISETYTISHRTWRSQAIMGLEAFSWPVFIVTEGTVQATEREREAIRNLAQLRILRAIIATDLA